MALVATYGDTNAFNIQIFDMAGGGYYAVLYDASTKIFQRRNTPQSGAGQTDTHLYVSGNTGKLDHFLSYSYNSSTSTLTLSGAADTFEGVTFTRSESYRFVSSYVVENVWSCVTDKPNGKISATNWNYYDTVNAIWDIDNTNFGDNTSNRGLGLGIQLVSNGPIYGCTPDRQYNIANCARKRALASQTGIAVTWMTPGDASQVALTAGVPFNLTQWFFKSTNTLYDFMLQAQLAVASAKGYTGTNWEKICKVSAYLNTSLGSDLVTVKVQPNWQLYSTGTWMRDSFWASFLFSDSLEQSIMQLFESKQQNDGRIVTDISGSGVIDYGDDENTLLYVIRSYCNLKNRGVAPNTSAITNAMSFINGQVVNNEYRITSITSGTQKMWNDRFKFTTDSFCAYNQGIYCVALKCAKLLGQSISDSSIANAITKYQSLYNGSYMQYSSDKTHMGPDVLVGEALSIFLFGQKLLTDAMVNNTIDTLVKFAKTPVGLKDVSDSTGAYLSSTAFSPSTTAGDYHNGGSWFLYDYLAYYCGFYHGYPNSKFLINERINAELGVDPVSHEYLKSDPALSPYGSSSADRHVYSWNTFYVPSKLPPRQPVV